MNRRLPRVALLSGARLCAAVLAAGLLSGCGTGSSLLGSAAVVDDERISVSDVQATLEGVRDLQTQLGAPDPQNADAARNEVHRRVIGLVFAQAARDLGVGVTEGELANRVTEQQAAAGSEEAFLQGFALQNRITPAQVVGELRRALLVEKMSEKVAKDAGVAGSDPSVQDRLTLHLVATAKKMDIKINPRYGTFDAERGQIVAATPDYVRAPTPLELEPADEPNP